MDENFTARGEPCAMRAASTALGASRADDVAVTTGSLGTVASIFRIPLTRASAGSGSQFT
jgi:hypothetical protein